MCGRFTLRRPLTQLADEFSFDPGSVQLALRYNIAPTQDVATVRLVDGKRQLAIARWRLIPSWAKDLKIGYSTINARADTVATKPAFRSAYKKRRCLVLAGCVPSGQSPKLVTRATELSRLPRAIVSTWYPLSEDLEFDAAADCDRIVAVRRR